MGTRAILEGIYSRLPRLACRGLCAESCGPIVAHDAELQAMERRTGRRLEYSESAQRCGYLTTDNRCAVHDVRPLICRLWGAVERMPCVFGCQPERVLTDAEGYALIQKLEDTLGDRFSGPRFIP